MAGGSSGDDASLSRYVLDFENCLQTVWQSLDCRLASSAPVDVAALMISTHSMQAPICLIDLSFLSSLSLPLFLSLPLSLSISLDRHVRHQTDRSLTWNSFGRRHAASVSVSLCSVPLRRRPVLWDRICRAAQWACKTHSSSTKQIVY